MPAGSRLPFEYPKLPHHPNEPDQRRHKPPEELEYRRYKEYLRDEFVFTCVYCQGRETWLGASAFFGVEHYHPKSKEPELASSYTNLLYVCNLCNTARGVTPLHERLHPEKNPFGLHLEIDQDGTVRHKTPTGEALIDKLKLNRAEVVRIRSRFMTLYRLLKACRRIPVVRQVAENVLHECYGFPEPLVDLTSYKGAVDPYCARQRAEWY
jgi:hypothetical protein